MNNKDIIKIIDRDNPIYKNFPETPEPEVYNLEIFDGSFIKRIKKILGNLICCLKE